MGVISYLFGLLFLIVPLVFFPKTSELFEFNKIIAVYIFTIVICGLWIIEMIKAKKIIFRTTRIDIPLAIYLAAFLLSTFISLDFHTSLFGYYGRFNGGFLSLLSYALLYWAFASNVNKKSIKYILNCAFVGALIVSVYGILEHFGHSFSCLLFTKVFDDACWVQDVRTRVFATLGQPNWMASTLVALLPLAASNVLTTKEQKNKFIWAAASVLLFTAVIFTKSRSGLLGLGAGAFVFLGLTILKKSKRAAVGFLIVSIIAGGIVALKFSTASSPDSGQGGTESGEIRKLVWQGAIGVWQHYPVLGSGLETFAYSFPQFRPAAHNLTSEWDFIYNKAHNEYLNIAATGGSVGIIAYTCLISFSIYQILKSRNIPILAGYVSVLVTNFFGFSVVVTQLFLFLFPAIAIALNTSKLNSKNKTTTNEQKFLIFLTAGIILFGVFAVGRYWLADYYYAQSKESAGDKDYKSSIETMFKAFDLSPNEPFYHDELARQLAQVAIVLKDDDALSFAQKANEEGKTATKLSYYNVPLRKNRIRTLLMIADVDKRYLNEAIPLINETQNMDGNDPFIFVEKGKAYVKLGQLDLAIDAYKKAVDLKANYQDARYALGILYKIKKDYKNAKMQFQYILDNLSPDDEAVKKEIKNLK